MYAYRKNNSWVYPVNLSSKFNGIGAWHLKTDEERAKEEFYPLVSINSVAEPHQIRSTFADIVLDEETLICTATYTINDKSLTYYQNERIMEAQELRDLEASSRPTVDSGLGFSVDGSTADVEYFLIGQRLAKDFVVDSEGNSQPISAEDWDIILNAVATYKFGILHKYWETKAEIESCTTLEEITAVDIKKEKIVVEEEIAVKKKSKSRKKK